MNKRMVFNIVRKLMLVEGVLLLLPMFVAIIYRENSWVSFAIVAASLILRGGIGFHRTPSDQNIYTKDGVALTSMVLGGLADEANLLDALEHADFENGGSAEKVRDDFANGTDDVVSFTYNDIKETLS